MLLLHLTGTFRVDAVVRRTYEVSDIHCEGCEQSIRRALSDVDGVHEVLPDRRTNRVAVTYDDRLGDDRVGQLLAAAGFPVVDARPADEASPPDVTQRDRGPLSRYPLLVVVVAVLAIAGYTGYELYPRFDLPAAEGAGLLVLATGAGIASFFAPCSFPLLVTLLSRPARGRDGDDTIARPLVFGAALAGGAAAFLLISGAAIAAGGSAFFESVTFTSTTGRTLRLVVGALLIGLGLIQLGVIADRSFRSVEGLTKKLNRSQAILRRRHPVAGYAAFGFFYLLAGFG
ncbi:hypothetical protein BH24ACT5_BH24ACT5_02830 [soil metagenome]